MATRAPAVAPELFGASLALGAWALLAAGALGVRGPVGLRVHRRGLLVLAAGLVVLALARPRADLIVPCVLAAAVLFRVGLVRWGALDREPDRSALEAQAPAHPVALPAALVARAAAVAPTTPRTARVAGRLTARAGTVLGQEASSALPRAARAVGRVAGRARQPPPAR
jgi:hypothetical protein